MWASTNRRINLYGAEIDLIDGITLPWLPSHPMHKIYSYPLVAFRKFGAGPVACLVRFEGEAEDVEEGLGKNGPVTRAAAPLKIQATLDVTDLLRKTAESWLAYCFGCTGFHEDIEKYLLNAVNVRRHRISGVNQMPMGDWSEVCNGVITLVSQYHTVAAQAQSDKTRLLQENKRLQTCLAVQAFMGDELVDSINAMLTAYLAVKTSDAILQSGDADKLDGELFDATLQPFVREVNESFDVALRGVMEKALGKEMVSA
jgi:hypothetical protein